MALSIGSFSLSDKQEPTKDCALVPFTCHKRSPLRRRSLASAYTDPSSALACGLHGFSLQPVNINIQVHPGYEHVLTLTPTQSGEFGIICNEFCGIGHHTMTGRIYVTEPKQAEGEQHLAEGT